MNSVNRIPYKNSNCTIANKYKKRNNTLKSSEGKIWKRKSNVNSNQCDSNCYLPILDGEKDIVYTSNGKINITTTTKYADIDASTFCDNNANACKNQLQHQLQKNDKSHFDLVGGCGMANINICSTNDTRSSGVGLVNHMHRLRHNNDKLLFKLIHMFVLYFLIFANCFGITNSDNDILFEDGNITIINTNYYDNTTIKNMDVMVTNTLFELQQHYMKK